LLFGEGGSVIRSTARVLCASPRSTIRDSHRSSHHWGHSAVRPSSLCRAAADGRTKVPWVRRSACHPKQLLPSCQLDILALVRCASLAKASGVLRRIRARRLRCSAGWWRHLYRHRRLLRPRHQRDADRQGALSLSGRASGGDEGRADATWCRPLDHQLSARAFAPRL
jgi:hypothetical protein